MGGRFKREGMYIYLWLNHVVVWQKPIQHCKAIILQLKKKVPLLTLTRADGLLCKFFFLAF